MKLTYLPTYQLIYLPRFADLKMELTYIPTYWLIYLPCFCKRYNGAYLSIDLPTDLCTYQASQTLKWSANGVAQICRENLFRRISESKKIEDRRGRRRLLLISALLLFFLGPRRWNLSLAFSPWSLLRSFSITGHHAAGNIFALSSLNIETENFAFRCWYFRDLEWLLVKLSTLVEDLLSGKKQQGMMDCVVAISML